MKKPRVLIVGVGRLGDALVKTIAPSQPMEIALFDTDPSKLLQAFSLEKLAGNADFIFLCTPAFAVRSSVTAMHDHLIKGAVAVSFIKGLDETTGKSMHELLTELLPPTVHHAIVGGPMLSAELLTGQLGAATVGAKKPVFHKLRKLFEPTRIRVDHCSDVQGVAMAGVLKNVYALGLGMASALELGQNVCGALTQQSLQEMTELLPLLGGKPKTAYTLAGVGDLVATGTSPNSRNRTVGHDLVRKGSTDVPSEGLVSLPILLKRLGVQADDFALLTTIKKVVVDHADARQAFSEYVTINS